MFGRRLVSDPEVGNLLRSVKTIAVIGCSPNPGRDSHRVAAYLQSAGYRVVPVHPARETILGEPAYPSLAAAAEREELDLVDVFRRPEALPELVDEAIRVCARPLWFQLGVVHEAAEERALAAGLDLVVDRCILVEHRRLFRI